MFTGNSRSPNVSASITTFNGSFAGLIQWIPRTAEIDYVDFDLDPNDQSGVCFSPVGRVGGMQQIGGSIACTALVHEMGHAIGLWHEQSRADRNVNVKVQYLHAVANCFRRGLNCRNCCRLFFFVVIIDHDCEPRGEGATNVLVNWTLSLAHACYVSYNRQANRLYLENDAGSSIVPGGAGTLSNSQCTLLGSGSSVKLAGNVATLPEERGQCSEIVHASGAATTRKRTLLRRQYVQDACLRFYDSRITRSCFSVNLMKAAPASPAPSSLMPLKPRSHEIIKLMPLKYSLLAGLIPACLYAASVPTETKVRVVEQIVAKVNGEIITQTELEHQRELITAELRKDPALIGDRLDAAVKEKQADALRDQIDQLLLVQRGKDLNINVDPEITRRVAQVQAESKKLDPEEFHKWVQEQAGIPFEDFRNQMKNQMLTQRVISQEVAYKIQMPKSELKDYYEKHKSEFVRQEQVFLREILVTPKSVQESDVAAAEKKVKDIRDRARKGIEKFGDLARMYSDAPTAQQDGELGAFKRGDLRKEIEDIVFKANRGYVTDPVRTNTGFVILKVEDRYEAGQASFEDVQNEIMEKMYAPKMQPEIRKYLTQLRKDAFIEIRGGYVDSGAAADKDTSWKDPATLKPETTTKEEVAARKRKRLLGVIPRRGAKVSSSDPGSAPKMPATPAPSTPPTNGGSSSSSSSSSSPNQ